MENIKLEDFCNMINEMLDANMKITVEFLKEYFLMPEPYRVDYYMCDYTIRANVARLLCIKNSLLQIKYENATYIYNDIDGEVMKEYKENEEGIFYWYEDEDEGVEEDTMSYKFEKNIYNEDRGEIVFWICTSDGDLITPLVFKYIAPKYKNYLESKVWKEKSEATLKRAGYKCQLCGKTRADYGNSLVLNAHHNIYDNKYHEKDTDLISLCQNCHEGYHKYIEVKK